MLALYPQQKDLCFYNLMNCLEEFNVDHIMFTPNRKLKLENDDENFEITEEEDLITEVKKEKKIQKKVINTKKNEIVKSEEKKVGFLSYLIVAIISLIALIIIVDTFQIFLKSFFPNIDIYLSSLYDSLTDIFLFLKDLIK